MSGVSDATRACAGSCARAHAREEAGALDLIPITVTAVRVPPGSRERRSPVAMVDTLIGPLEVTFTVSALRRGNLVVRPPQACGDGQSAVGMAPPLADKVVATVIAAVKADATARPVLARERSP